MSPFWQDGDLPDEEDANHIDLPYSYFASGQYNADWPIYHAVYVDYMICGLRGYFSVAEEELAAMYQSQQQANGRVAGYANWGVYLFLNQWGMANNQPWKDYDPAKEWVIPQPKDVRCDIVEKFGLKSRFDVKTISNTICPHKSPMSSEEANRPAGVSVSRAIGRE